VHHKCEQWSIDIVEFAFGQYRIQILWDGPKGREFQYPDMIPPNF
jgi:hypothetical protein